MYKVLTVLTAIIASSSQLELEVKLNNQYVTGWFSDYNLCQIYTPVSVQNDGKFFTGVRANQNITENVRYMVLHKCRWSSRQDGFYGPFLNQAFECEDTRFVQVLQTCHEEVIFMWSKGIYGDYLPAGYGLELQNSYLMMMVIYEALEKPLSSENSGLILSYEQEVYNSEKLMKPVHRLLLGHQASGKHVILSNHRDWISDGFCSSQCTKDTNFGNSQYSPPKPVSVLSLQVHTRSLGTVAHIDVMYNNGSKYDTPMLAPTSFSELNTINRVLSSTNEAYSLHPGDEVILRCHHSTLGQDLPIFGGVAATDELCFAILTTFCPKDEYCPFYSLTSCMSRPTDETIANSLGFKLDLYETQFYEKEHDIKVNKSSSVRFVDLREPGTNLEPPKTPVVQRKRRKRQTKKPSTKGDLFLTSLTLQGNDVLSAIDAFDKKATLQEKTSANFAILNGYHLSECSDSLGTFNSVLVRKSDAERNSAKLETRPANSRYHEMYNASFKISSKLYLVILFSLLGAICN